jgi:hypothetical protein
MNKFIVALVAPIAMIMAGSVYADNFDSIDVGGSISAHGLTLSHDDDTDLKLKYSKDATGYTFGGSLHYERTALDANVIGFGLHANNALVHGSLSMASELDWDLTNTEWDSETTVKYSIFNIGVYTDLRFDIDDLSYSGNDFGLEYNLKVSDAVSIVPSIEVPFNNDFDRQDATAAINIAFSF